jgi:Nucleotidyltransferase/DNA polymerase involved in DNA repair
LRREVHQRDRKASNLGCEEDKMLFMLIDMDYFFAACEEHRRPELKGKPFVVGTSPESQKGFGVVQTSNYVAREFGVRSGMSVAKAMSLCKELIYVESDDEYYESISKRIIELLRDFSLPMEAMSIDEWAVAIGDISIEAALKEGQKIKERIKEEIGLPCTIGISSSKIYSKMVCDEAKPDGLEAVPLDEIKEFIKDKEVSKIPGIGPKAAAQLEGIGITKIGEITSKSPMLLIEKMGSLGTFVYNVARGADESGVQESEQVLSIGRETTLTHGADKESIDAAMEKLVGLTILEVEKRGMMFKGVSAKVRYQDFSEKIKSAKLKNYTASKEMLSRKSKELIAGLITEKPVRKVGVRVYSLTNAAGQKGLF